MKNKGASIFILPVFILFLSIISTFMKGNTALRDLYSHTQIANPLIQDAEEDEGNDEGRETEQESTEREDSVSNEKEDTKETIPDTKEVAPDVKEPIKDDKIPDDKPIDAVTEPVTTPSPEDSSSNDSESGSENSNSNDEEGTEETTPSSPLTEPEEEVPQEEVEDPAALLLAKQQQFILSRDHLASRFRETLATLENSRDQLEIKIKNKEDQGVDTRDDEEALSELDDAIDDIKSSIKDNTIPDTIPGLQRAIIDYVIAVREAITDGLEELRNAAETIQ